MKQLKTLLFGGLGAATPFGDVGLAILRIGIGLFIAIGHGHAKIFANGFGPDAAFVAGVRDLGFPAPLLFAWLSSLAEFVGGLFLAVGLLTRLAALGLAFNMVVATFLALASAPLFASGPGPSKEFGLLYLLPAVMFIFTGGGRLSIDALLRRK